MYTSAVANPLQAATTLEDMQTALDKLKDLKPTQWLLMAPNGQVWKGDNPMQLAAIANADWILGWPLKL